MAVRGTEKWGQTGTSLPHMLYRFSKNVIKDFVGLFLCGLSDLEYSLMLFTGENEWKKGQKLFRAKFVETRCFL